MRLFQLRAGTRILGAFSLLLAALALGSLLAVWRMATGEAIASELVNDKLAKQQLTADLLGAVRLNNLRVLSIAHSDSLELADLYSAQLAQGEREAAALEKSLLALPASPAEQARLAALAVHRKAAEAVRAEVFRAKDMGRTVEVEQLVSGKLEPAFKRYTEALSQALAAQAAEAHALAAHAARSSQLSRVLVIALGLGSVVGGILLAWHLTRTIVAPLQQAVALAEQVAAGDLRAAIEHRRGDEIGRLFDALNQMTASMSATLGQVMRGAGAVDAASGEIEAGNLDLSRRTARQGASLRATAASMQELTAMVRENSVRAHAADQLARTASGVASEGGAAVANMAGKMAAIRASASRISDITGVIDGIAFQTNILALNAAVEAARAGQEGRGFAVVAGEVRQLAQRCAEAARGIKKLIGQSNAEIDAGMDMADAAAATMRDIVGGVQQVSDILAAINAASARQAAGIERVNTAVAEMDDATRDNAVLVEQAAGAAHTMRAQAHALAELVATFRVADAAPAPVLHLPARRIAPARDGAGVTAALAA